MMKISGIHQREKLIETGQQPSEAPSGMGLMHPLEAVASALWAEDALFRGEVTLTTPLKSRHPPSGVLTFRCAAKYRSVEAG